MRGVLPIGTRLRIYEVVRVLGQGAFGITYLARDTTLNRDVAIKEYLPASLALREHNTMVVPRSTELADDFVWGRERFLDEARTLAKLESAPAVVRVIDFLEANGTAYMVMALVRGETLEQSLRRDGRLGPSRITKMLEPLLDGLEQVHGAGFLHRDIKPSNIIVDSRDNPTLIDFGASRAAIAGRSTTLTAVFTPGYAAPEQFGSSSQGPWTDIYGLSATLYQAITGIVPPNSVDRILEDTHRPLVQLAPHGFSAELLAGIDAGLSVRALQRPQNISEWRSLLRGVEPPSRGPATVELPRASSTPRPEAAATLSPVAPAAAVARDEPPPDAVGNTPRIRRRPLVWASVGLALLLVIGGGYTAYKLSGPAVESLTMEQLEQALAERRKAEALAAEKKRLEEDAARRAAADSEAKRQADAELERARQQRMKAEAELAKLKAEADARQKAEEEQRNQAASAARRAEEEAAAQRKADAEIAALRQAAEEADRQAAREAEAKRLADEEARRKLEAEAAASLAAEQEAQRKATAEAEAKRQADEALAKAQADREQAEADARGKASADAQARAELEKRAETDAKKRAETAELALNLPTTERQRLQVALTSLGFDTGGTDGVLGPRSREMLAAWQKARNQPITGYLTAAQQQALLKEAAAAVAKYDEQQKKVADDKKEQDKQKPRQEPATQTATVLPAQAWKATLALIADKSPGYCDKGSGYYSLAYTADGVFTASTANGKMFSVNIPADGTVNQHYRSPSSGRLLMEGNVKTRDLVVTNVNSSCRYRLVPQ